LAKQGMPENPVRWLYQSAGTKPSTCLKKWRKTTDLSLAKAVPAPADDISEHGFKDAQCNGCAAAVTRIPPKMQVVLALNMSPILRVEKYCEQLGRIRCYQKMLYRARQKIKSEALILSA